MEIVKGWHKRQREDRIQQFFAQIAAAKVLTLQFPDAELAGRIYADLERTGQPIGLADSMIAAFCASLRDALRTQQRFRRADANAIAIAIQNDLTLVTGNLPHYQRLQSLGYSLKLDNWRI